VKTNTIAAHSGNNNKKITDAQSKDRAHVVNNVTLVVHRCCSESSDRKSLDGGVKSIIDRNLSLLPWLTRSQVYYAVNKIKGNAPDSTAAVSHVDPNSMRQLVITNNSSITSC